MKVVIEDIEAGDDIRISASTYVAWRKCPDSANVRLQGIFGPDSRPGFVGSLAHRVFSRHLSTGPIPSEEFVQACREEIGGSSLNNKLGGLELRPSALAGLIEEVRGLYERFVKWPDEGFEGTEVVIEKDVGEGVQLVGTIDAIYREEGVRLVDWKTGELGEPQDQMLFYALLWAADRDELPARVEAVSVRTGERFEMVPSAPEVGEVLETVREIVVAIRSAWAGGESLPRHGGPWCKWCPVLEDCPEGRSTRALLG